jgi:hypothetical protein
MSRVDELIDTLARDAAPVRPLKPPVRRALIWLAIVGLISSLLIYAAADVHSLAARYPGREALMALEMVAMLTTGVLATVGAFCTAIPGRSPRWLLAPLLPFAAWMLLSGAGCYHLFMRGGASGLEVGHSLDCLVFIVVVSLLLGAPLLWLLSRARPIEALRVALLGGLGSAAIAAFILQFFHPFAVTFVDLTIHLIAIALVVGTAALLNRRSLLPA